MQLIGQSERQSNPVDDRPSLGRPIRLWVSSRRSWLRPAWAALCGALASGGLAWDANRLLRWALLAFLVDVVWGGLWSALAATDWATPLRRWQSWRAGSPVRVLPYTTPDSLAGRLAHTLGHLRSWWNSAGQPTLGPTVGTLVSFLPLALVMAGVLGARPFLLTLAAIALLQFVFAWRGGDARPMPGPQALFEIALPWLAGHALFDPLTIPSTLLALSYTLSYMGGLRLEQNRPGLTYWNLGQALAVILLVALRQPLAAGVAALLMIGQGIAQPGLVNPEADPVDPAAAGRLLRFGQLWLMVAMLVAAWGLWTAVVGG